MALSKEKSKVPGALFIFDTWDKNKYGLPAFHRYLMKTLGKKKGKSLQLYSTVLSDEISESHKRDAEKLGVTLLIAKRRKRIIRQDDPARLTWLHHFESYYPEFQKLNEIQYIIGYAPKTGDAAADIRDGAFPSAQLVLINHASPENDCALVHRENLGEFEQRMLKMATEADLIFSMGPKHYGFFQNQYRVSIGKKDLQGTPHEEILPVPSKSFFRTKVKLAKNATNNQVILTYGTFDDDNLVQGLEGLASAVGSTARLKHETYSCLANWDIHGVNKDFQEAINTLLHTKLSGKPVPFRLFGDLTMEKLATKQCQSHVCLPIPVYGEYSFDGLEALALGVPLLIAEYTHLASFIKKYLPHYEKHCVVRSSEEYPQMIGHILKKTETSFEIAGAQKRAFKESKEISKSYKRFAAMLAKDIDSNANDSGTLSPQSRNYAATGEEKRSKSQAPVPSEHESLDEESSQNIKREDTHESESEDHYPRFGNGTRESSIHRRKIGSDEIIVKIKLNEDDFNREMKRLEEQTQQSIDETMQGQGKKSEDERQALEEQKRKIPSILEQIKKAYRERVSIILKREDSKQFLEFLSKHCNNNHAILKEIGEGCLALFLKFRFLQNLSKFRGSCLTGRFTKPLEQFLITKEMRLAAKHAEIDLKLVPVYDADVFHKISDFFIERDGGSDVTEESTSSGDDDVDTDRLELPNAEKRFQEAASSMTTDQLQVQLHLAETEELQTNPRLSSMEISILQRERDDAILEKCLIENKYRQLQIENKSNSKKLIEMKNKLNECQKKYEKLESELNRDKRYTGKSQEQHLEPDDKDNNRPESETKQSEIQPQTLKWEKKSVIEEQLQIVQRGKTLHWGIPLGQDNEISVQRNQIGLLGVSAAPTGGTNNTVSGEMMQVRGTRLSNTGDNDVHENESRATQQLVTPLHPSKEQSRYRKNGWKVMEQSMSEDLDNDCTSNRYSTPYSTAYYTIKKKMLTASQKGKRRAALPYFRRVRGKDQKGTESAREASVTRKDEGVIGASRISSSRPVSEDNRESHTATSSTWSVKILGTWSSTRTPGNFNCPRGLRWHRNRLVVCDRENHRVQILDEDNQYEAEIRFDSQFPNKFQPWEVAISDDKYYVTDIGNNQIIVCYQNCEIIEVIHLTARVNGITIMAGFVWVTECQEYSILKYTLVERLLQKQD
ncbi:uncharacterized protein [Ptychodera flava]|uniref:uncharacterized protein n=1 Tax=Ptychodera flava TaxID=63121 RepID=UPI00396A540F